MELTKLVYSLHIAVNQLVKYNVKSLAYKIPSWSNFILQGMESSLYGNCQMAWQVDSMILTLQKIQGGLHSYYVYVVRNMFLHHFKMNSILNGGWANLETFDL